MQRFLHEKSPIASANPDSVVMFLDSIANDSTKFGFGQARSLISFITGKHYPEVFPLPNQSARLSRPKEENKKTLPDKIKVYPNPFTGKTTIEMNVPDNAGKSTLFIYNLLGEQIKRFELMPGFNSIELPENMLLPGLYIASLKVDKGIGMSVRLLKLK